MTRETALQAVRLDGPEPAHICADCLDASFDFDPTTGRLSDAGIPQLGCGAVGLTWYEVPANAWCVACDHYGCRTVWSSADGWSTDLDEHKRWVD